MGTFNIVSSLAVSVVRLGAGLKALDSTPSLATSPVTLYEFEGCPYCRKVREALTELNLEADIKPCPRGGTRFRAELKQRGGKDQYPYLIDPNTGWEGYESAAIVDYLFATYGNGRKPGFLSRGNALASINGTLASATRPTHGIFVAASSAPALPLELYSFEASPFCRIARERLCELEIPYRLHNVGKGSPSREAFVKRSGKMMVPYLVDPNTGAEMFESADIVRYLTATYAQKK